MKIIKNLKESENMIVGLRKDFKYHSELKNNK